MQYTLGQKLEEARKRQGMSLREAAEATKIRGDILLKFEAADFGFDLPEVYKRGFLRVYARLLKLDQAEIMADYDRVMAPAVKAIERPRISEKTLKRELFGQMELGEEEDEAPEESSEETPASDDPGAKGFSFSQLSSKWLIIGAAGLFALVTLFWAFSGDSESAAAVNHSARGNPKVASADTKNLQEEAVTLVAVGDVYVVVRQEIDRQKLFVGSLKKGERVTINKSGPIKIQHTMGENLMLEKAGQRYAMNATGLAVSQFE